MPNRIIKESICTSDTIDQLTWFEEVFFYRLIVNCDDYGRFDARLPILKARLFPLKSVTEKQISDALNKLSTVGIVTVYEYDGRPYLQLVTWDKHQQIRAKKSKYPAPEEACNQMISDDIKCPRNPIQSNPNKKPIQSESPNGEGAVSGFDLFWSAYPKKVGKKDAVKAWNKINPDKSLVKAIIEGVERWKGTEQWNKDGGQFIPYPATFLRQERWNDEVQPIAPKQQAPAEKNYDDDEDFLST